MRTTLERYNKLKDMELVNTARYDINARVEMIIREIQQQIQKWEDEARAIYWPEKFQEKGAK